MSSRTTRTLSHPYSGAWENEFDTIFPNGRMSSSTYNHPCQSGWQPHVDGTTGTEHASPVWASVRQAADSIKRQYASWSAENDHAYPLEQNGHGMHSSGAHIHIGKGRGTNLEATEVTAIGKHYRLILPLIQAINAAPLPSERGLHSSYCHSIVNYSNNFTTDHYCELSWNREIGTCETRIPDPNIPPAVLTNLYLLGHISEHARELCDCSSTELAFDAGEYSRLRTQALTHGIVGIPMVQMLTRINHWLGSCANDFEVDAVRDVLFMASKYYSSPHQIFTMIRPNLYDYMRVMFQEPSKYLTNLTEITNGENRQRVTAWANEAAQIHSIQQLIDLAQAGITAMRATAPAQPVVLATTTFSLNRSEVQRAMEDRIFLVHRITDVPTMSVEQVRSKIAYLLSRCGDGFTNPVSDEQVSQLPTRFYVMAVPRSNGVAWDIAGCIGINVGQRARTARDSEVGHLAVHRMYRRLGIAKVLVNHVKAIALENNQLQMHTHIKIGNTASEELFRGAGYVLALNANADPSTPQGSRKWVLSLAPQVQGMGTQPSVPGPAPPTPAPERSVAPREGAFAGTPERGQSTLADLVNQMRLDEQRERIRRESGGN